MKSLWGEALAPMRDQVVIATKFGFQIDSEKDPHPVGVNSRPEYIKVGRKICPRYRRSGSICLHCRRDGRTCFSRGSAHLSFSRTCPLMVQREETAGEAINIPAHHLVVLGTTGSGVLRGVLFASRATPECCGPQFCEILPLSR